MKKIMFSAAILAFAGATAFTASSHPANNVYRTQIVQDTTKTPKDTTSTPSDTTSAPAPADTTSSK